MNETDPDARLRAVTIGAMMLGRELLLGVISEATADPPRGLNAIRLARHLWELEHELHYVHDDPGPRLEQIANRDRVNRREVRRSRAFRDSAAERLASLKPKAREAATAEDRERGQTDRELVRAIRQRQEEVEARVKDGDVDASEFALVPGRRRVAKAIGRGDEYTAHYEAASLYAHPSVLGLDNVLTVEDEVVHPRPSDKASALPGMALSLARMAYARLARRSCEILDEYSVAANIDAFMEPRGIGRTGIVENPRPDRA